MIHDQIEQIDSKVRNATDLSPETRQDLLNLIAVLKTEVDALSQTNEDAARSVAGFAAASAHEATRAAKKPELLETAVQGLTSSVAGLEVSHPKLSDAVNRIATVLSNMGI
jgi:hypothetical protein